MLTERLSQNDGCVSEGGWGVDGVLVSSLKKESKHTEEQLFWGRLHPVAGTQLCADHQHTPDPRPPPPPFPSTVTAVGEAAAGVRRLTWTENNSDHSVTGMGSPRTERRHSCCNIPVLQLTRRPSLLTPTRSQSPFCKQPASRGSRNWFQRSDGS